MNLGYNTGDTVTSGDFFRELLDDYDKYNKEIDRRAWFYKLLGMVSSMFVREGLPGYLDDRVIEPILMLGGCGAYVKDEGKVIFGVCKTVGMPNRYYIGKDAIVTAGGGYCKEFKDWENNKDIVVCWNNHLRLPDLQIWKTANDQTEIDVSLLCNLLYSRLYPVGVASDDKTKTALEELFNKMKIGTFAAITSENVLNNFMQGTTDPGISVVNLTDVAVSDKIQYLAKYHDDVMRWFWSYYGQNVQAASKLAQESVAESTSGEGVSMITPHDMYHERQREAKELKRKFGWNVSIEFTEPWQNAFADCESENGTAENAEKGKENDDGNGIREDGGESRDE